MTDYMKEAERLAPAVDALRLFVMGEALPTRQEASKHLETLLAHIQRGAVPEGWQLVPIDPTPEMLDAAEGVDWGDEDMRGSCCNQWHVMLAAAPDQFRDAAKMMAEPAEVPMPEAVGWYVSGSDPEHAALWLECPDDEQMQVMNQQCDDGPVTARPVVLGADAERYGDAREAAGYARVLEWAVSRWKSEVENRPLENKNRRPLDDVWRQVVRFAGGDPDALLGPSHDAALRGEVK